MPKKKILFEPPNKEIRRSGIVVGETDKIYTIDGPSVIFDEVLVRGDLSGELEYNKIKLRITRVNTIIGLQISPYGPRGPVWKGVECQVLD